MRLFGKLFMKEKEKQKARRFPVRAVVALALTASLAAAPALVWNAAPIQAADSLATLKNKKKQIEDQQKQVQQKQQATANKLAQLKQDKSKQQAYKEALDEQMSNVQDEVRAITEKIANLDQQIRQKEAEISDQQRKIDAQFDELKDYLRKTYKLGEASKLEILLNAENIVDFSEKLEVVRHINNHEAELIGNLKAALAEISDQKKEIESNRAEVASEKKTLEVKQAQVQDLLSESQRVLEQLKAQESEQNKLANELSAQAKTLSSQKAAADREIDAWYAEYYRKQAEEERRRKEQQNNNKNNTTTNTSTPVVNGTGRFTWPCPGVTKITSYWGDGRGHKALDIAGAGAHGKTIVAADSGTVMRTNTSGWGGGYGLYVMIDHGTSSKDGQRYSTMYAHCSSVMVRAGQRVSKGQAIARIGNTGDSYGAHLHFEVRKNGVKVNPLPYLR